MRFVGVKYLLHCRCILKLLKLRSFKCLLTYIILQVHVHKNAIFCQYVFYELFFPRHDSTVARVTFLLLAKSRNSCASRLKPYTTDDPNKKTTRGQTMLKYGRMSISNIRVCSPSVISTSDGILLSQLSIKPLVVQFTPWESADPQIRSCRM